MWTYLWQNFLVDAKVRYYIAEKIFSLYQELGCESLIEIWPGKGAITKLIEHISNNFFVIEKDVSLAWGLRLEAWGDLNFVILNNVKESKTASCLAEIQWRSPVIIQWDVLAIDVEEMLKAWGLKLEAKKMLIVGNLPYYITSPILTKFFGMGEQHYAWWLFMLQDEVGQKLRHDAKKKSYLRWLINYAYKVEYLKSVPAKCFKPVPKVKSCLVQLTTKNEQLKITWKVLLKFLDLFAPFSRKTLWAIQTMHAKKSGCDFVIPESLKKKRLEELTWKELEFVLK